VADFQDQYHQPFPVHSIDHAVIADPDSIVVRRTLQFLRSRWKWIAREFVNIRGDATLHGHFQGFELAQCRGCELDGVGCAHG